MLLVKSKPELKEDAKSAVFQKYRDLILMGNTCVHHETDDDLELSKLSAFYSVSFVCDQIQSMLNFNLFNKVKTSEEFFTKANILNQVGTPEEFFTKANISFVSFCVLLKDEGLHVGSVDHDSYFCNSEKSLNQLKQNLELETIQQICRAFGYESYLSSTDSSRTFPSDAIHLPFDIDGRILFKAVTDILTKDTDKLPAKVTIHTDVNSRDWRQKVADGLYTLITGNMWKIKRRFDNIRRQTKNDLGRVRNQLEIYKNLCHHKSVHEGTCKCRKSKIYY